MFCCVIFHTSLLFCVWGWKVADDAQVRGRTETIPRLHERWMCFPWVFHRFIFKACGGINVTYHPTFLQFILTGTSRLSLYYYTKLQSSSESQCVWDSSVEWFLLMHDAFISLPQAETDRNDCFNISLSSSVGNEHILHWLHEAKHYILWSSIKRDTFFQAK